MRNRHGRRADRCLAVYLRVVTLVDLRIVAAQPDPADWKSGVTSSLRDTGFLQERKRATAGAEKNEFPSDRAYFAALDVFRVDAPAAARFALQVDDPVRVVGRESLHGREITNKAAGQGPVVHIRTAHNSRRGHLLIRLASLHHQRYPVRDLALVLGIF